MQHEASTLRKKRLRVILPDSRFRKVWINIQLFVVLYIIWVTPVRVVSVGGELQMQAR